MVERSWAYPNAPSTPISKAHTDPTRFNKKIICENLWKFVAYQRHETRGFFCLICWICVSHREQRCVKPLWDLTLGVKILWDPWDPWDLCEPLTQIQQDSTKKIICANLWLKKHQFNPLKPNLHLFKNIKIGVNGFQIGLNRCLFQHLPYPVAAFR